MSLPVPIRQLHKDKWRDVVDKIICINTIANSKGINELIIDILFIREHYVEPKFRYKD